MLPSSYCGYLVAPFGNLPLAFEFQLEASSGSVAEARLHMGVSVVWLC